jgi:hypothetical protein
MQGGNVCLPKKRKKDWKKEKEESKKGKIRSNVCNSAEENLIMWFMLLTGTEWPRLVEW